MPGAADGIDRVFEPAVSAANRAAQKASWDKAVHCSLGWAGKA